MKALATKICHAVEQRSDDVNVKMRARVLAVLERELREIVNAACACGGRPLGHGCCPACEVWPEAPAPAAQTALAVAPGALDLHCCDCMDLMREFPDGHFDLAIVDPPYGISAEKKKMGDGYYGKGRKDRLSQGAGKLKTRILQNAQSEWDAKPPGPEYFAELRRVSRNQIIWGGNYFPLPPTRCVVSWDKEQPWPNFSAWEMAWTSFDMPAKLFRWNNQGSGNPGKIHPTQKPVELYDWLLTTFAEPGQRILDTHLGSGSIAIACHYFGAHLTGSEIDPTYHAAAVERVKAATAQTTLLG